MLRVFGRYIYAATLALGIAEAVTVCAIIYAVAVIFSGNLIDLPPSLELGAALIALAVVLMMHSVGLYDETELTNLRRALVKLGFIIGPIFALAVITTGILAKSALVPIYPYRWQWTIALTTLWFASVLCGRLYFAHLHDRGKFARRIALLGDVRLLGQMRDLVNSRHGSIRVVAQFDGAEHATTLDQTSLDQALLCAVTDAKAHEIVVDQAVLSSVRAADLIQLQSRGCPCHRVSRFVRARDWPRGLEIDRATGIDLFAGPRARTRVRFCEALRGHRRSNFWFNSVCPRDACSCAGPSTRRFWSYFLPTGACRPAWQGIYDFEVPQHANGC